MLTSRTELLKWNKDQIWGLNSVEPLVCWPLRPTKKEKHQNRTLNAQKPHQKKKTGLIRLTEDHQWTQKNISRVWVVVMSGDLVSSSCFMNPFFTFKTAAAQSGSETGWRCDEHEESTSHHELQNSQMFFSLQQKNTRSLHPLSGGCSSALLLQYLFTDEHLLSSSFSLSVYMFINKVFTPAAPKLVLSLDVVWCVCSGVKAVKGMFWYWLCDVTRMWRPTFGLFLTQNSTSEVQDGVEPATVCASGSNRWTYLWFWY